jgi:hypothetical protein
MVHPIIFKKVIFLFFCTFLVTFHSYSQNIVEGYWGLKAGPNFNKISNIEIANSMKGGFHAGLFANFQISDKFSFQHELLYSMKGVSLELPNGDTYIKSFSFIDIPWMLNYHLTPNFYISGGVQPSIYAYFKQPKADTIVYNKDNVNTIDFGYLVNATFLSTNNFGFGVRFTGSVFPTFDLNNFDGKNYVLQAYIMYAVNKRQGRTKRRR